MDVYRNLEYLETLLVEDNPLVRDAMTLGFRTKKLKVSSVESAEEGLKFCMKCALISSLVIMDFRE